MNGIIPETSTDEYSEFLKEIIQSLMDVKQTLKRGRARRENRKEVNNLQSAIKALRYLEKKNKKAVDKLLLTGDDGVIRERRSFSNDDIRNFLYGLRVDDENY